METKGNFVLIGLFAMVVTALSFAFFYWDGRYEGRDNQLPITLEVRGSAAGLGNGSSVLFNGIRVGQVTNLSSDLIDPNLVLVHARIDKDLPIKVDTRASVSSQGITGLAVISLDGGSVDAPRLLDQTPPLLKAGSGNDLLSQAQQLSGQAGSVLTGVERIIADNRSDLDQIIDNTLAFSKALSEGSEDLQGIIGASAEIGGSIQGLADAISPAALQLQEVMAAIEPERVAKITQNIEQATDNLAEASADIKALANKADDATANVLELTQTMKSTVDGAKGLIGSATGLVTSLSKTAENADLAIADARKAISAVDSEKLDSAIESIKTAALSVENTVTSFEPLGKAFAEKSDEWNSVVSDMQVSLSNIRAASGRLSGLMSSTEELINEEGTDGLIAEATSAAKAFREFSEILAKRGNTISGDLEQFSTRGLKEIQQLIQQTQAAVQSFEQLTNTLEENPRRAIFGGSDVKEFDGRQRR